jgi:2-C-methyl-D-erythritol 2,4-cyclodiphosphate synthase
MYRIGQSYDIHKLSEGIDLILGGVKVDSPKGCVAHSDGDVLLHAITEAIIGALGLGDLGTLFPDTDKQYENISSVVMLEDVIKRMKELNFKIVNIDSIVIAQKPNLSKYKLEITNNIKKITACENVNVKATTNEGIGEIGAFNAISAQAVVLLEECNE